MPVNWDPGTFQEFRRAVGAGECEVVLHGWTGDWPKKSRLEFLWFFSERWFIRRLTASERDFWLAYRDGAFDLHQRERSDPWGRR